MKHSHYKNYFIQLIANLKIEKENLSIIFIKDKTKPLVFKNNNYLNINTDLYENTENLGLIFNAVKNTINHFYPFISKDAYFYITYTFLISKFQWKFYNFISLIKYQSGFIEKLKITYTLIIFYLFQEKMSNEYQNIFH